MWSFKQRKPGTGYIPDKPDSRDARFTPSFGATAFAANTPENMRGLTRVLNQGNTPECVSHAAYGAIIVCERLAGLAQTQDPSIEGMHYLSRYQHGSHLDPTSGTYIRELVKVVSKAGVPLERLHPTRYTTASMRNSPSAMALIEGNSRKGGKYVRLYGTDDMLAANRNRLPFIFGIEADERFATLKGDVPWQRGGASIGWHAMLGVWVDSERKEVLALNSWGTDHGDGGYVRIPFTVMARAIDVWAFHGWQRLQRAV